MNTVVIVTRSRWDEPPRIRHQVARQLARFNRVIFVETPLTWKYKYQTQISQVEPNLFRCTLSNRATLPVKIQHYIPYMHYYVEKYNMQELNRVLEKWPDDPYVLINFNYDSIEVMRSDLFGLKVYLCNDDFPAAVSNAISRFIVKQRENKVAGLADLCLAVHYPLVKRFSAINPNTKLFWPGHDFEPVIPPAESKQSIIKVAFMGFIDNRIEYSWLEHLVRQGDMELHLIGPIQDKKAQELTNTGKVCYYPPKYGQELQSLLVQMNVLVIPYKISMKNVFAVTASNKLFTYLAMGKPVLISDMPNYLELERGLLYRASSKELFIQQVRAAYSEDCLEFRKLRYKVAQDNTWEKRGLELNAIISEQLRT